MTRTILMTGCSSGIGYVAAHIMRDRGWHVFAACRSAQDCARLEAEGFDSPLIDYADDKSIHAAVKAVLEKTGGTLDVLYNNGAYAIPGAVEDMPTDALRAIFESNFFGWHTLTRAVIPAMRAQGHGRIVQCSSVLGLITMPWRGAYSATKFALEGLTDTLRMEMKDTNINVILIEPGPITSDFRRNSIAQFERWIDWRSSDRSRQYETQLRPRLYDSVKKTTFELGPEAVVAKLILAAESPRPRPRYYVTLPTYFSAWMRRLLPTSLLDRVMGA